MLKTKAIAPLFIALALALSPALALSGCSQAKPGATSAIPAKSYGGTFVYALAQDITNLAPVLAQDAASTTVSYQIHEGLTRYEGNYKIVGALASSWEVSQDGKTWTFRLRDKVKWHDGHPFTSADVKFTYEKLLDPATKSPRRKSYAFIKDIQTPDPLTVRFVLSEPHGPFLDKATLGIMAKHHFDQVGNLDKYNQSPLGTGPFKFKEWVPDERLVLEANTSYWLGRPYLDKVIFKPVPEASARVTALKKGEVHYVWGISPDEFRKIEGSDHLELFRVPALSFAYLALNNQNSLFRDVRVKEAFLRAIDRPAVIRDALGGFAVVAAGPYSPVNEYYYNGAVKRFAYDPDAARKSLDEAGYKPGRDQIRQIGTTSLAKRLEFTAIVRSGDETWKTIAMMCQKWFLDIGVKMNIEYVDWTTLNRRLDERSYEAAMLSFSPGPDPDQFNLWHSSAVDGGYNDWRYVNPDVDKLLEQGRKESEPTKRRLVYAKIQEILAQDVATIWLYHPQVLSAMDTKFKGMAAEPMGQDRYLYKVYEAKAATK